MGEDNGTRFCRRDGAVKWAAIFKLIGSAVAILVFMLAIFRMVAIQIQTNSEHASRLKSLEDKALIADATLEYMQSIEKRLIRIETILEENRRRIDARAD